MRRVTLTVADLIKYISSFQWKIASETMDLRKSRISCHGSCWKSLARRITFMPKKLATTEKYCLWIYRNITLVTLFLNYFFFCSLISWTKHYFFDWFLFSKCATNDRALQERTFYALSVSQLAGDTGCLRESTQLCASYLVNYIVLLLAMFFHWDESDLFFISF